MKLLCGSHNHDLAETLVGHPYAGRLTNDEKSMLVDMIKTSTKPRSILLTLKKRNEKNLTTIKVYNAMNTYRRIERRLRTKMQHLIMLFERDMYLHWCRFNEGKNVVQDLFWTHPDSIKLPNSFDIVLMMDSTYKTNMYKLPLLYIIGVMSTGQTFSVTFILVEAERENNFVWALERLKGLFTRVDLYPKVIVSDKDLALMNTIGVVFLEAYNILYQFHVDKNVKAKCKMIVHPREAWD